ncbi:MAG: hypothetical protein RIB31_01640, partial [Thalassobaculaceae bacterium]
QACIEDYVLGRFEEDGAEIDAAIAKAKAWDLSSLPTSAASELTGAITKAESAFDGLKAARATSAVVEQAGIAYDPIRTEVRRLEADLRRHVADLEDGKQILGQLQRQDGGAVKVEAMKARIELLTKEKGEIEAAMPADWDKVHSTFKKLLVEEKRAYLTYRRTVDQAYQPIQTFLRTLRGAEVLKTLRPEIAALADVVRAGDPEAAMVLIQAMEGRVGEVEAAGDVRTALSKARRALRSTGNNQPNPDEALTEHATAMAEVDKEIEWRSKAAASLLPQIETYEEAIRGTIGLRSLSRLPRDVSLSVASCSASHSDLSLNF